MSRQIDVKVAEALGLVVVNVDWGQAIIIGKYDDGSDDLKELPLYSTDIRDAMEALLEFSDGRRFDVGRNMPKPDGPGGYYCTIGTQALCPAHANAETVPLAICQSILAASGKGEKE